MATKKGEELGCLEKYNKEKWIEIKSGQFQLARKKKTSSEILLSSDIFLHGK